MSLKSSAIRHRHQLISLPAEISMALTESKLLDDFFFRPRYENYRQQYKPYLPEVNPQDKLLIDSLSQHSFFRTTLSQLALPETPGFLRSANIISKQLEQRKDTDSSIISLSFDQLLAAPEFFNWGLQERLVSIAGNYLETPPAYDTFSCNLSKCNGHESGTRLWHIDHEDRRMLKIIIYLSDVDENSGPFQFIHREATKKLIAAGKKYHFWTQDELDSELKALGFDLEEATISCTGARGTVLFVDTTHFFHRGKPPLEKDRKAAFFGYMSRRPSQPYRCGRSLFSRQQLLQITQNLTDKQKKAVFWKDELNPLVKLIPRYRYYKL